MDQHWSKILFVCMLLLLVISLGKVGESHSGNNQDGLSLHTLRTMPEPNTAIPIKHIVIIMQENRAFDHYFGTYPGVDGIPAGVCLPYLNTSKCIQPFHDTADINYGNIHDASYAIQDIDSGKMDGFLKVISDSNETYPPDIMGYHDRNEIPNYWAYADNFVLHDHMYEPCASFSLPAHLFLVSGWAASCTSSNPMSCVSYLGPDNDGYPWTDLTYLLHKNGISWAYYLNSGTQPDREDGLMGVSTIHQDATVPGFWNPLPSFETVQKDGEVGNVKDISTFYTAAQNGTLPAVSWVIPSQATSEHPPAHITVGQAYVTGLINAVMQGPDWNSTAIILAWDDWGGFYDHSPPPAIDENGYGIRVPSLVISPYARKGYIDHQILSFDAYLKFIEDVFLNKQRIDPNTDGRPDSRPDVREDVPVLGDLMNDFDFTQQPRPPLVLDPNQGHPAPYLQNTATGELAAWFLSKWTAVSTPPITPNQDPNWRCVAVPDLNGDGWPDLVFQNQSTGQLAYWLLNDTTATSAGYIAPTPQANWVVVAAADMNGDRNPDLILQNTATGRLAVWYMNGAIVTGGAYITPSQDPAWRCVGVGDFNSDGQPDLLFQNSSTGKLAVWYMNGTTATGMAQISHSQSAAWKAVSVADYNADNKPDILFQNSSTGQLTVWYMSGIAVKSTAILSPTPSANWVVVGPH